MKRVYSIAAALLAAMLIFAAATRSAAADRPRGRIFILMVWDGLRPDFVTQRDTPNLYRLEREGVRFDRHHSIFPTLTMANGAALATGAMPAVNGLEGNVIYWWPVLSQKPGAMNNKMLIRMFGVPYFMESTPALQDLNASDALAGRLLGIDSIAQEVEREGGYIAVLGKQGPTYLFDNRFNTVKDGKDSLGQPHHDYLFASDDAAGPPEVASEIMKAMPPSETSGVLDRARDAYFTRLAVERAIPAAKQAAEAGRPVLIVLWQHNPDITQHMSGIGTAPAIEALGADDDNLGRLRAAVDSNGIADRTDVMVVSDHGFATIRMRVSLAAMLVSAGLKKSLKSNDVVIAANGGSDLIYLSPADFKDDAARHAILQKIVDFAAAQQWCGPIFARDIAPVTPPSRGRRRRILSKPFLGAIDGTFAQAAVGLYNPDRSPDLVISFDENPDQDNRHLTGPGNPAFAIDNDGQQAVPNMSAALVRPVKGVVYADVGAHFTTGMGMHGAAGARELHNYCGATGPDFRRGYVDQYPTANTDVTPTIMETLGLLPNIGVGGVAPTGRVMTEALNGEKRYPGGVRTQTMTSQLELQGVQVISTLHTTSLAGQSYLDGSTVVRRPLGSSP
jgi:arylsulfatase A-like enzyme